MHAATHLFEVNESGLKFKTSEAELFHHNVAKLLLLCKHERPDIQRAVAFLYTWVKSPDQDDYKKLTQIMKYLRHTQLMPLNLEASDMNVVKCWVDASYAVFTNIRSHTDGVMTLVSVGVYAVPTKHKPNSRSTTESDLGGLHDVMLQILWRRNFHDRSTRL